MSQLELLVRAGRLAEEGRPFALVTVVRVEPPASARQGDRALVLPDGSLVGWVGGACSEPIVVREALRALADGETRFVRIGPPGTAEQEGVVCAVSECASEGTVEVLVEPQRPAPLLAVVGESPAARTLARLAAEVGWRAETASGSAGLVTLCHKQRVDAVVDALAHAGVRNLEMPVTSDRVWNALREVGLAL